MANLCCPFTWGLERVFDIRTSSSNRNLDEYKFSGIPLMPFLLSIVRSFECMKWEKDVCAARKYIEEAEITLSNLHKEPGMLDIIEALQYIYQATATFIIHKNDISQTVPNIQGFNKIQSAALDGCKSFILGLYHLFFIEDSIRLARSAVQGNPTNALWHYVLGHSLRKKRRNCQGCEYNPSTEETSSFARASSLDPHAFYKIYCIQAYHEANFHTLKLASKRLIFTQMQWNMYKDMEATCNDQPVILLKVVLGMLRCQPVCDYSVVHSILDRVDELSKENNISYFYRGRAYKLQHLYEKAFEYLKRSADMRNFVADLDYVHCMLLTQKPAADIIIYLVGMRIRYKNDHVDQQLPILLNLAIMYYKITDYATSAVVFLKAIQLVPDSPKLKGHYVFGNVHMKNTYDFLKKRVLPNIIAATRTDPEFADTFRQLQYYCTRGHQQTLEKGAPSSKGNASSTTGTTGN